MAPDVETRIALSLEEFIRRIGDLEETVRNESDAQAKARVVTATALSEKWTEIEVAIRENKTRTGFQWWVITALVAGFIGLLWFVAKAI